MKGRPRKPDFFLVGAPRCATTAVFAYLRQHPQIFMPLRKEPHFFGADLTRVEGNPWFVRCESDYLELFEAARDDQTVGEASVLYLYSRSAAREIHAFNSAARILIQLRNPVDMIHSYHGQLLLTVQEDIEDFESAYAATEQRRRHERIPRNCIMYEQLLYADVARYAEQVRRYFETFGRERVHVMIYDDFRRDPRAEFARILQFLGVDTHFEPEFALINRHRKVRFRRLQAEAERPSLAMRCLLRMLPDNLVYRGLVGLAQLNSRPAEREPLSPVFRERLKREFADDVAALSELLGRDLTYWTRT